MPFKSEKQRRWMHANKPEMAKRWEDETPKGKDLPEEAGGDDQQEKDSMDKRATVVKAAAAVDRVYGWTPGQTLRKVAQAPPALRPVIFRRLRKRAAMAKLGQGVAPSPGALPGMNPQNMAPPVQEETDQQNPLTPPAPGGQGGLPTTGPQQFSGSPGQGLEGLRKSLGF